MLFFESTPQAPEVHWPTARFNLKPSVDHFVHSFAIIPDESVGSSTTPSSQSRFTRTIADHHFSGTTTRRRAAEFGHVDPGCAFYPRCVLFQAPPFARPRPSANVLETSPTSSKHRLPCDQACAMALCPASRICMAYAGSLKSACK
jgi:hypothetical protein